ncbi:MAG: PEP-CTERM sorting domain-containing protein [Verrucomicrobiota bacterium]
MNRTLLSATAILLTFSSAQAFNPQFSLIFNGEDVITDPDEPALTADNDVVAEGSYNDLAPLVVDVFGYGTVTFTSKTGDITTIGEDDSYGGYGVIFDPGETVTLSFNSPDPSLSTIFSVTAAWQVPSSGVSAPQFEEVALNTVEAGVLDLSGFGLASGGATLTAVHFNAVPEPGVTALLGLSGMALIFRRRRIA